MKQYFSWMICLGVGISIVSSSLTLATDQQQNLRELYKSQYAGNQQILQPENINQFPQVITNKNFKKLFNQNISDPQFFQAVKIFVVKKIPVNKQIFEWTCSFPNLTTLVIHVCKSVTDLKSLENLKHLKTLKLYNLTGLIDPISLKVLHNATNLETLCLRSNKISDKNLEEIQHLPIKHLELFVGDKLTQKGLSQFPNLESLILSDNIETPNTCSVIYLELEEFFSLYTLKLRSNVFFDKKTLAYLSFLAEQITTLSLETTLVCPIAALNENTLPCLDKLTNLTSLSISLNADCSEAQFIKTISKLKKLKEFSFSHYVAKGISLKALAQLPELETLKGSMDPDKWIDLPPFNTLKHLSLSSSSLSSLSTLEIFLNFPLLEVFSLNLHFQSIGTWKVFMRDYLPPISSHSTLKSLAIVGEGLKQEDQKTVMDILNYHKMKNKDWTAEESAKVKLSFSS